MNMKRGGRVCSMLGCVLVLAMGACSSSKDKSNGGADASADASSSLSDASTHDSGTVDGGVTPKKFDAPPIAPIVRKATPGKLKPMAALHLWRRVQNALELFSPVSSAHAQVFPTVDVTQSITTLFQDMYTKVSGGQAQGLINSSLLDMDERVSFVEKMPSNSTCLNAETKPLRVDLSTFSPAFDLTLDLQCRANGLLAFGHHANGGTSPDALVGDDGGVFSGEDAGHPPDAGGLIKGGDDYSLWLYLPHGDKDAFGYFANVRNANTEDESVDFMFLENDSTTLSRIAAYRVKAKPKTKRFEFVYASTNGGGEAGENLRCGFRMISDGTYVWAVGTDHQLGTTCAESKPFTRCLLASDLSEAPDDSVCRTLDQQFTMGTPSGDAIATAGDAISAVLPITASEAVTSPF